MCMAIIGKHCMKTVIYWKDIIEEDCARECG
jgi:hypothetical protein